MNLTIWNQALNRMITLTKAEWDKLDIIGRWLISTRAVVLIMTFISVAIAGILAWRDGQFVWWRWALLLIGLVMAHGTNNILNDITDFKKGVDQNNYYRTQYGLQPIESGFVTEKQAYLMAGVTGLIALIAGLPLVITSGIYGWILLALGAVFVLTYTWPLKFIGLGELTVFLVWGPLMVAGGYFVITMNSSWDKLLQVALASLPYALGTTMVIFGKHIDKLESDKAKGIHTLPVIIGEKSARIFTLVMLAVQYGLVLYLILSGYFSAILLFVFMAVSHVPNMWKMFKAPKPESAPEGYPEGAWPLYFVAVSFVHNREFGLWYLAGLLVDTLLRVFHLIA